MVSGDKDNNGLLLIAPYFRPSVGGAETYAEELCEHVRRKKRNVYVLAYQPLVVSGIRGEPFEKGDYLEIRRYSWIGFDLMHKMANHNILLFLYLTPYLLFRVLFWMLRNGHKVNTVDAQGLSAAFVNKVIKLLYRRKRTVSTMLALYNFKPGTLFARVVKWVLDGSDYVLVEKGKSRVELASIGVPEEKMVEFNQWVDEQQFKPGSKAAAREKVGWHDGFFALFVGRAIPGKGADILLEAALRLNPNVTVAFITNNSGPIAGSIIAAEKKYANVMFVGEIDYRQLHLYYQAADVFCIPSKYEEGVARVVAEAVSCGTPIISSNMGSLPYVLDERVAVLIKPAAEDFAREINFLYDSPQKLNELARNCPAFAKDNFGKSNLDQITSVYER